MPRASSNSHSSFLSDMERNHASSSLSRRCVLSAGAALVTGALGKSAQTAAPASASKLKVAIFSKHLLFLQGTQLAEAAASIGFDGIDLAVRKGGHVEPERVRQDLPPLVKIIRQHGLEVSMITTDIQDAATPYG